MCVVEELPICGDRKVEVKKVAQARMITAVNCLCWDEMTTQRLACLDSLDADFRGWEPEIEEMKAIAVLFQIANPGGKGAAGECRFEGDVLPLSGEFFQAGEHDSAGIERGALGVEGGEASGDDVGVHEFIDMKSVMQKVGRSGAFAGSVGAGEDDDVEVHLYYPSTF